MSLFIIILDFLANNLIYLMKNNISSEFSRSVFRWWDHPRKARKAREDIINIRTWTRAEQTNHSLTVVQPRKVVSLECLPGVPGITENF